jgi:hypothetical protein
MSPQLRRWIASSAPATRERSSFLSATAATTPAAPGWTTCWRGHDRRFAQNSYYARMPVPDGTSIARRLTGEDASTGRPVGEPIGKLSPVRRTRLVAGEARSTGSEPQGHGAGGERRADSRSCGRSYRMHGAAGRTRQYRQALHRAGRVDLGTAAFLGPSRNHQNTPKMLF